MKLSLSVAATLIAASTTFSVSNVRPASGVEPCTGPFRQCAIEVQAYCSRDSNGRVRMTYYDLPGYTMRFEQCVGRIFEASGRPNPYTTGVASYRGMTVPYTELLYPLNRDFR
jgi:hypothetical protein